MLLLAVVLGAASRALAQTEAATSKAPLSIQAPSLVSSASTLPRGWAAPLPAPRLPTLAPRLSAPAATPSARAASPASLSGRLRAELSSVQGSLSRSAAESRAEAGGLFDLSRAGAVLSADEPGGGPAQDGPDFPSAAIDQWKEDFKRVFPGPPRLLGGLLATFDRPDPKIADLLARGKRLGVLLTLSPGLHLCAAPQAPSVPLERRALAHLLRGVQAAAEADWAGAVERADLAIRQLEKLSASEETTSANLALARAVRRRVSIRAFMERAKGLLGKLDEAPANPKTADLRRHAAVALRYLSMLFSEPERDLRNPIPPLEGETKALRETLDGIRTYGPYEAVLPQPRAERMLEALALLAERSRPGATIPGVLPGPVAGPDGAPGAEDPADSEDATAPRDELENWKAAFKLTFPKLRPYPGMTFILEATPSPRGPSDGPGIDWTERQALRSDGVALGALLPVSDEVHLYSAPHPPAGPAEARALEHLLRAVKDLGKAPWSHCLIETDEAVILLEAIQPLPTTTRDNLELARAVRRYLSTRALLDRLDWLDKTLKTGTKSAATVELRRQAAGAKQFLLKVHDELSSSPRNPIAPDAAEAAALKAALAGLAARGLDEPAFPSDGLERLIGIFGTLAEKPPRPHPRPFTIDDMPAGGNKPGKVPGAGPAPEPDPLEAVPFLKSMIARREEKPLHDGMKAASAPEPESFELDPEEFPALTTYADNLVALAAAGELPPMIGRQKALNRLIRTLTRWSKRNPMLVGPPGSGKSAIVDGLALAIAEARVPALEGKLIFRLDMAGLVAGAQYLGTFEERVHAILDELKTLDGRGILFGDEAHMILGLGKTEGSESTLSNILKQPLARGEMSMIGATTDDEYRIIEKDGALKRRFKKVIVEEATPEETLAILKGLKPKLEEHHGLRIPPDAREAAVRLSERHLKELHFPDKAIDLLDEAASLARLADRAKVTPDDVAAALEDWTGIPVAKMTESEAESLRALPARLKAKVIAQDEAVDEAVAAIRVSKAGLGRQNKTVGAFLAVGPTGVGKTELARVLAEENGMRLVRLDGSEYASKETASRLIGAAPGLVGYEDGGQLTEPVRRHPHSLVLLDELEQFHPSVLKLLLQVMDDGRLTDSQGRTVDFTSAILWLTSNLTGQLAGERHSIGFEAGSTDGARRREAELRELERKLEPKLFNRLDAVLFFNPLPEAAVAGILDLQLRAVEAALAPRGLSLALAPAARALVLKEGFDARLGARPLDRALTRLLRRPLADALLDKNLAPGSRIEADAADGRIILRAETPKP